MHISGTFSKKQDIEEKYNDLDIESTIKTILSCLIHISEERFYGIGILISTLRGSKNKAIEQKELYVIEEYGSCKNISSNDLRAMIQWLMDNHYMIQTKGLYPKLHITYEGNHFDEIITPDNFHFFSKRRASSSESIISILTFLIRFAILFSFNE